VVRRLASLTWRAADRFFEHNGPDRAAAIAFYTLLSLLPMLIFLISLGIAFLGSFDAAYRGTLLLFRGIVVPLDAQSLDALRSFVERAARFQWPGILILAWTSRRVFGALLSALSTIFDSPAHGFASANLIAFALVLLSGVALLLTLVLTTMLAAVQGVVERVGGRREWETLVGEVGPPLLEWLPLGIAWGFSYLMYRYFPRGSARPRASHAIVGASVAALLWEAAQVAFAYYVRNLAHYGSTYGALEGILVLALWLELSATIVLYGAEVAARLALSD
jgi:membrane protein